MAAVASLDGVTREFSGGVGVFDLRLDLPPGRGNTPFADYLAAIRDAGFTGTVSLELEFPPDPGAMLSWVEEAYDSTRKLLAEAGV